MNTQKLLINYTQFEKQRVSNEKALRDVSLNPEEALPFLTEALRIRTVQNTMKAVETFLDTNYKNILYSPLSFKRPSRIVFNKHQGNSVGVSQYLLNNLDRRILVLAKKSKTFTKNANGIIFKSSPIRVFKFDLDFQEDFSKFDQIIIDGVLAGKGETFYQNLPQDVKNKVVFVGS